MNTTQHSSPQEETMGWEKELRSLINGRASLNPMYGEIWMQEIVSFISSELSKAYQRGREDMKEEVREACCNACQNKIDSLNEIKENK